MKIIHLYLPTLQVLHDRNSDISPTCLRCQRHAESFQHIFQCQCRQNQSCHRNALRTFRSTLQKIKTHPLIIHAFANILDSAHTNHPPKLPSTLIRNRTHLRILSQIFAQQTSLGPIALCRGFIVRNWSILQNLHKGSDDKEEKDIPWLSKTIRALWTYSATIWLDRCKAIHSQIDGDASLTHIELQQIIRKYLQIDRSELSADEKKLHLNVIRTLPFAHTKTLVRWLDLLKSQREATLRRKRESRRNKRATMRPLTSYFRKLSN